MENESPDVKTNLASRIEFTVPRLLPKKTRIPGYLKWRIASVLVPKPTIFDSLGTFANVSRMFHTFIQHESLSNTPEAQTEDNIPPAKIHLARRSDKSSQ